jgi:hypothetical protein
MPDLPNLEAIGARLCFQLQWYYPHLTMAGLKRSFERLAEIQRDAAAEVGASWIDLNPVVPPTDEYYWDFCHTTPAGTTLVADALAQHIAPIAASSRGPSGP